MKVKESWQAKRKRETAEAKAEADKLRLKRAREGRSWTKGAQFGAVGSIRIGREMLDITLSFAGVTRNGVLFLAEVVQTGTGWAISICLNGTQRGSYESIQHDLRAAVIEAVDRFA